MKRVWSITVETDLGNIAEIELDKGGKDGCALHLFPLPLLESLEGHVKKILKQRRDNNATQPRGRAKA